MDYKEKLKALLEGLEVENIDEVLEKDPDTLNRLGKLMAERIKDIIEEKNQLKTFIRQNL